MAFGKRHNPRTQRTQATSAIRSALSVHQYCTSIQARLPHGLVVSQQLIAKSESRALLVIGMFCPNVENLTEGQVPMSEPLSGELLLAEVIRGVGSSSFFPELLEYMRGQAPFRGAFIVAFRSSSGPEHLYDNVRAERRSIVVDRWLDAAWRLDPFVVAFRRGVNKGVSTVSDVAPDRFTSSEYYRTYYRSVRLRDEMGLFVDLPDRTLFLSIGRLVGERRFTQRDVERFQRIHPVVGALCQQHFARHSSVQINQSAESTAATSSFDVLTDRERDVVELLLQGHSTNSVAATLDLSPSTVKVHRKNIYRKLEISSQGELFALYLQGPVATD